MAELVKSFHPTGEHSVAKSKQNEKMSIDTFQGKVQIQWDPQLNATTLGQLPFFVEYLKISGLFAKWVEECPLTYLSNNAPSKTDALGTILLSVLSGHQRYAHISRLQNDRVNPPLLGMRKVISEDAVRRALTKLDEEESLPWLHEQLKHCVSPLLTEPWILDVDVTVKPLYGNQEEATVGYNPKKPGRPSHAYHSYMIANLRLMLGVDVLSGKESQSVHSRPGLWQLLHTLPRASWPQFIRGDCGFGNEGMIAECELKKVDYLFKLRCTKNVIRTIEALMSNGEWQAAGKGWQGCESRIQLSGWKCSRRIVVLRRPLTPRKKTASPKNSMQKELPFDDVLAPAPIYEYQVLVTSLSAEILTIAQHYRDRADCENNFDELKNQWGWCGFTTRDVKRCRLMANIIALIYNWWSLYVRLSEPGKRTEAITSRPLLLEGVAVRTEHARQTEITVSSIHKKAKEISKQCGWLAVFFKKLRRSAEQLSPIEIWYRILSQALIKFLRGRELKPPAMLPSGA